MSAKVGLSRLAIVLAATYWITALIIAGCVAYGSVNQLVEPKTYTLERVSRTVLLDVKAYTERDADIAANHYLDAHPEVLAPNAPVYTGSAIVVPLEGEFHFHKDYGIATLYGFYSLLVATVVFAILWAIYAALRWVVIGFSEPRATES